MRNQGSVLEKSSRVNLHLVEPYPKVNHQFSALRYELKNKNIPYQMHVGFDQVKHLMLDKSNKNIIIINNSSLNQSDLPKEIFNINNFKIFLYPKQLKNLQYKSKPEAVSELYRKEAGLSPPVNKINLRSIKKDLQKSNDKFEGPVYDRILVMNQRGANERYQMLFKVLQKYREVKVIDAENNVQNHRDGKSLLILQKQAFQSVYRFINENRLNENIDLAVVGLPEEKDKFKHCAIMTDYPVEIIDYIGESGFDLKGARQKLIRIHSGSGFNNSDQNTGVFASQDHPQFSFNSANKNNIRQEGEIVTFNNPVNSNEKFNLGQGETVTYNDRKFNREDGEIVEYEDGKNKKIQLQDDDTANYNNHSPISIPIASKISETSNTQKSKKPQIKKIKKVQPNASGISSTLRENEQAPAININTVQSQASQIDKFSADREAKQYIGMNKIKPIPNKLIMNWQLYPNQKAREIRGQPPNFILKSQNGQLFGESKQNIQVPTGKLINGSKKEIDMSAQMKNKNGQKPRMDWKLFPDRRRKSQFIQSGPFFILHNEKQNIGNVEQNFVGSSNSKKQMASLREPQLPSAGSLNSKGTEPSPLYSPSSPQGSARTIPKQTLKKEMHWLVYPEKTTRGHHKAPNFITEVKPNKDEIKIIPYVNSENPDNRSKEIISQTSINSAPQTLGYQLENRAQKIQQKYFATEIKQLSEEYRTSYVSYENSQRVTNNSNSLNILGNNSNDSGRMVVKSATMNKNDAELNNQVNKKLVYSHTKLPDFEKPTSRVVRQQPRSAETYYMEPSYKKIEEPTTKPASSTSNGTVLASQTVYKNNNVLSPASNTINTATNSYNYLYTNPYTNPYSKTTTTNGNEGNSLNIQAGSISSKEVPHSYYATGSTSGNTGNLGNMGSIGYQTKNETRSGNTLVTNNHTYTDNNRTVNSTTYSNNNTASPTTNTTRTSYYNNISNPYVPSSSSLNKDHNKSSLTNLGIDQSKYDVIEENGVKTYRLKRSQFYSPPATTPSQLTQADARTISSSRNNPVIANQATTTTSSKNVLNFNDYDEHIDERGNRYYTVKKTSPKLDLLQSGSNTLLIQSKKQEVIQTKPLLSPQQRQATETSKSKYEGPRYSVQLPTPTIATNINTKITTETQNISNSSNNFSKYYAGSAKELQKTETVLNGSNSPVQEYRGIEVGVSRPSEYNQGRINQYSNQVSEVSRMTPDSLLSDSKSSSFYKFNAHLYGETKPYLISSGDMKIQSADELERVAQEMKTLKTQNNFTHYIIDVSHPLRYEIEQLPSLQDQIVEVQYVEKIYENMLKKPLPNEHFDIGFIFMNSKTNNKIQTSQVVEGYYIVDINDSGIPIDIRKQKKRVTISNIKYIGLVKKLLLAPNIQHFIFYPRSNQGEISTLLGLFPSNKFNKFGYNSRIELEGLLQAHLRNKGRRLTRTLIFVNPNNLNEIAPLMDHTLNHKTFTMICNSRSPIDDKLKRQYKKVKFQNDFDFSSFGSVISLANQSDKSYIEPSHLENRLAENAPNQTQSNGNQPIIYIQHPHKGVDEQINKEFPGTYDVRFFTKVSQIKERSKDNFILLHRQADNTGSDFDANIGTLILLGGKLRDKGPIGTVNIETVNELIEKVL